MNAKYLLLSLILVGFTACSEEADFLPTPDAPLPALTAGSADFSTYVAVGASFTAGFTDNALFIAGQENSFPNMLSQQFSNVGGSSFSQPLMSDNIGGFLFGGAQMTNGSFGPRLFFDGAGPVPLPAVPTTEATTNLGSTFRNMGVPGAKSFHLGVPGYGSLNPYFGRMATSAGATVTGDAAAQLPSFFTLSEIGGNDVLSYATSGGVGVDQTGNFDPNLYGSNDITDPMVFAGAFNGTLTALMANGADGVVANIPYITDLPHFTTVPHNPLEPSNPDFGPQIPTLNTIFGALNQIFVAIGQTDRVVTFSETEASAVLIRDEDLADISATIEGALNANPAFPAFIAQFNLPPAAAPLVAALLGNAYGQTRQATEDDLLVLPSSSVIGTVNTQSVSDLMLQGLSQTLAVQFSVEGVSYGLNDQWVLIPSEQNAIAVATDAYNVTIEQAANDNGLAFVDFKAILQEASTTGISTGDYTLTTDLVVGGLVSLDGIHLTARGYSLMANEFMKAIDATYGSNFEASGSLVDAGSLPTNYAPTLQ